MICLLSKQGVGVCANTIKTMKHVEHVTQHIGSRNLTMTHQKEKVHLLSLGANSHSR